MTLQYHFSYKPCDFVPALWRLQPSIRRPRSELSGQIRGWECLGGPDRPRFTIVTVCLKVRFFFHSAPFSAPPFNCALSREIYPVIVAQFNQAKNV